MQTHINTEPMLLSYLTAMNALQPNKFPQHSNKDQANDADSQYGRGGAASTLNVPEREKDDIKQVLKS